MADTVAANSDLASTYVAGTTQEGREMTVIVLNPVKTSTRSLWIDCGIHAVSGVYLLIYFQTN